MTSLTDFLLAPNRGTFLQKGIHSFLEIFRVSGHHIPLCRQGKRLFQT